MEKIYAILPNRNLFSTLVNTVDFLLKDPRIEIIIYDQDSTYELLLEYYKNLPERVGVIYTKANGGPMSAWDPFLEHYKENYFIVADPDCSYEGVPDDWLDKMLHVLKYSDYPKVGFSLRIDDLPDNDYAQQIKHWEAIFWTHKVQHGWVADIDTTFALYRPNSGFIYNAIRLDEPYCIRHVPWYITKETLTPEWEYYLKQSNRYISYWGDKLNDLLWN